MIWTEITALVKEGEFKYVDIGIGGRNTDLEYRLGKYMHYIVVEVSAIGDHEKRYFGTESSELIKDAFAVLDHEIKAHREQFDKGVNRG